VTRAADVLGKQQKLRADCLRVKLDAPASVKTLPLLYVSGDSLRMPQGQALAQGYLQDT